MIKNFIHRLLRHRHPWREITFNELSEIYMTMVLRSLALSMTGIFVPIYMYRLDYSVPAILSVFAFYFSFRIILDFAAAFTSARIGPKHTLVIGQMLQIASSALFLTLPQHNWPMFLLGGVWGAAASFFFIPFHIDFSKIRHKKNAGKEIGFEQIMEKVGFVLGPVVGGVVATLLGSQYIFLVSIVLLIGGLWPLFQTREPVRIRQKLDFRYFPVHHITKHMPSYIGLNVENTLCLMMWPLFLGMFVISDSGVFAKVGIISSISVAISLLSTHAVGRTADNDKGRSLLRFAASTNAVLHLLRPFVTLYPVAFGVNVVNEAVTVGYRLPYTKGHYDTADDFPGYRIVYITTLEVLGCIAKATTWWILVLFSQLETGKPLFYVAFAIAAVSSLLIMTEKFDSLNPRKKAS